MKKLLVIVSICLCFAGRANAQWVVSDPGNLAQSIINSAKEMVETAGTKANTLNGFLETQKIFQQSKRFYDALKSVHDVVKGGVKVGKSIALVAEISEIYVRNFQNMLTDPNFTADELAAISSGYAMLLDESSDVLQDLKNVVNVTVAGLEKRGERHGHVALGCRTAGGHRPGVQQPDELPQPRELLHPQEHLGVLPAGEEKERHRPGAGSLRLGR